MILTSSNDELTLEEVSARLARYLGIVRCELPRLCQVIQLISEVDEGEIGSKTKKPSKLTERSPLSSRIARESLTLRQWNEYVELRHVIIDEITVENPIVSSLIDSLGFPAYWSSALFDRKGKTDLYQGASLWEMTFRRQGNDFMRNRYLDLANRVCRLSEKEISERLTGRQVSNNITGDSMACGLHSPAMKALDDDLLCWIAYHGMSLFPTRPVIAGRYGSISVGSILNEPSYSGPVYFVMPITMRPVTLGRLTAICRYAGLYNVARFYADEGSRPEESDVSWLKAHGVGYVIISRRGDAGKNGKPIYYASEGTIFPLEASDGR